MRFGKFMRDAAALAAATCISGCVPIPNVRYYAPAVTGVVTQAGIPVENAEVVVSSGFAGEATKGTTLPNGHFAAEPIRKFFFTALAIGDPLYGYSVQIRVAGKTYDGYSHSRRDRVAGRCTAGLEENTIDIRLGFAEFAATGNSYDNVCEVK